MKNLKICYQLTPFDGTCTWSFKAIIPNWCNAIVWKGQQAKFGKHKSNIQTRYPKNYFDSFGGTLFSQKDRQFVPQSELPRMNNNSRLPMKLIILFILFFKIVNI